MVEGVLVEFGCSPMGLIEFSGFFTCWVVLRGSRNSRAKQLLIIYGYKVTDSFGSQLAGIALAAVERVKSLFILHFLIQQLTDDGLAVFH